MKGQCKKIIVSFSKSVALMIGLFCICYLVCDIYGLSKDMVQYESNALNQEEQAEEQKLFDAMNINIHVHLQFQQAGGGYKAIPLEKVTVTAYNNLVAQTNSQPNIGASNRKVFEGSVAVSRDILRDYKVKYGDILCLKKRKECFFIEDTMNKRYDGTNGKRVDIFMYSKEKALNVHTEDTAIILQQL